MRAIKADGVMLPERYANVGQGRGRGRGKARRASANPASANPGLQFPPKADPLPPEPVAEVVSVDAIFAAIDSQFDKQLLDIAARLVELGDEHTRLNDALQSNLAEAEKLGEAGKRLTALREAAKDPSKLAIEPEVDPEADNAKDNGGGEAPKAKRGGRVAATV
jgi:hypothetical protein